jgi:hypothetical protein
MDHKKSVLPDVVVFSIILDIEYVAIACLLAQKPQLVIKKGEDASQDDIRGKRVLFVHKAYANQYQKLISFAESHAAAYSVLDCSENENMCSWICDTYGIQPTKRQKRIIQAHLRKAMDEKSMDTHDWQLWYAIHNGDIPVKPRFDEGQTLDRICWVMYADVSLKDIQQKYGRFQSLHEFMQWRSDVHRWHSGREIAHIRKSNPSDGDSQEHFLEWEL